MEKLPQYHPFTLIYVANSITDMHNSRYDVVKDELERAVNLIKAAPRDSNVRSHIRISTPGLTNKVRGKKPNLETLTEIDPNQPNIKYYIDTVLVYIPIVRHIPIQDLHPWNLQRLTLYDNLTDCNEPERRCEVSYSLRDKPVILGSKPSRRINWATLRLQNWGSGVLIQNVYRSNGPDKHLLIGVNNNMIGEGDRSKIADFVGRFVPVS